MIQRQGEPLGMVTFARPVALCASTTLACPIKAATT